MAEETEKKSGALNVKSKKDEKAEEKAKKEAIAAGDPYVIISYTNPMLTNALGSAKKEFRSYKKHYVVKILKEEFNEETKKYTVTLTLVKKVVELNGAAKTVVDTAPGEKLKTKTSEQTQREARENAMKNLPKEFAADFNLDTEQYVMSGFWWKYNAVYKTKVKDTSKDLGGILSEETIKQAAAAEKKSGDDFLAGKSSSPFGPAMKSNSLGELQANIMGGLAQATVNGVTQVAGSTLGVVGAAAGVVGSAAETALLCTNIVAETFSYISKELVSYVTEVVVDLASLDLSPIMTAVSTYLTAGLQTPDEMIKELMTEAEKALEDAQKAAEDEAKNAKMAEMKIKAQEFQQKVDTFMNDIKDKIDTVTSYIEAGPDWLEEKIDELSYKGFEQMGKYAGIATYTVNKKKEEFINNIAKNIAEPQAKKINEKAKEAQKKVMDEAKKLIAKAKAIAMALIAKALMLIMGLLGG